MNTGAIVSCVGEIVQTKLTYDLFHFIQSCNNFNVLYVITRMRGSAIRCVRSQC